MPEFSAILTRNFSSNQGTFGTFRTSTGYECVTGELPWRENARSKSCIPRGIYNCVAYNSRRFGRCYLIQEVLQRTKILIHHGNFCGDSDTGLLTESNGCILVGKQCGRLGGQRAVIQSIIARKELEREFYFASFQLTVSGIVG